MSRFESKVFSVLRRIVPQVRMLSDEFEGLEKKNIALELLAESQRKEISRLELLAESQRKEISRLELLSESQRKEITSFYMEPIKNSFPILYPEFSKEDRELINNFGKLYYDAGQNRGLHTFQISWFGHVLLKCPLDLWVYQELICRELPDLIIETGTHRGGSALYLASICSMLNHGQVMSIDIDETYVDDLPKHERITYITGSSVDLNIVNNLKSIAKDKNVLVILDSDHRMEHVLNELMIYKDLVPVGGYLIVEDTNINGNPAYPDFGPGPMEAVNEFLKDNESFAIDLSCQRFLLTMNPHGYLRRIK
ncbi:CmcI family methyltransferase [Polynucleobacter sp. JS-Fieb-80-E5]|uniref:CmcI family methyltransferase n=1 Tax=Polynucleobacter sp. JS-Fieb-80-E5 TaxID=2081050 RepID=UPI001C0CEC0D|nr:CmcI family methyltransferase [Polynucleobacter sp. JS-Fieb-80-E5]